MARFFQTTLRTSDVEAARRFYAALLGDVALDVFKLHEQAVARGARPHWLGFIDVPDVDRATAAFVERGATPMGPKWVNPEGLEASVIRDPGGAILALGKPAVPGRSQAVWHLLNTSDVERAKENYAALFGWDFKPPKEALHPFSWERGGPEAGAMMSIEGRPGVHPHWLFGLRVAALDPAMARVREQGGVVIGPFTLPNGERLAVCDDPQGAAFAMLAA